MAHDTCHGDVSRGCVVRRVSWGILLAACLLFVSCSGQGNPTATPVTVRIAGSTSLQPILSDLAAAYEAQHPNVLVDVRGGGSAIGRDQLRTGDADLIGVSWKPAAEQLPAGVQAVPVARDGIAIVVHPRNPPPGTDDLAVACALPR